MLGMTIQTMLEEMPASEYNRWKAFERMHGPLGPLRDDILTGLVLNLLANVNRDPKKKAYPLADFVPEWDAAMRAVEREGGTDGRFDTQTRNRRFGNSRNSD
jgi:hypothetical protein